MKRYLFFFVSCLPFIGEGQIITTVAGNGTAGYGNDGILAINAQVTKPARGCIDPAGNIYFTQTDSNRIRKIDAAGTITTIAGTGIEGFNGDSISAISASFNRPGDVVINKQGDLYIADMLNNRVRKIDGQTGMVTTVAGDGTNTTLQYPFDLDIDRYGNLFIAASGGIRILDTNGNLSLFLAVSGLNGICVDTTGNVFYIEFDYIKRKHTSNSNIVTVGGNGSNIFSGDGANAILAGMDPAGIDIDKFGNVFFVDQGNDRFRMINTQGIVSTIAGDGPGLGDGGPASAAALDKPAGLFLDSCANIYIGDMYYHRIRKITQTYCNALSVERIAVAGAFTLSPNPATSQLTITSNTQIKDISITNTVGQQVFHQVLNTEKTTMDIGELTPGIYFLKVTDRYNNTRTEKVVKQ